jgi:hypothetical protein
MIDHRRGKTWPGFDSRPRSDHRIMARSATCDPFPIKHLCQIYIVLLYSSTNEARCQGTLSHTYASLIAKKAVIIQDRFPSLYFYFH